MRALVGGGRFFYWLALLAFTVLVATGLNGSSIGMLYAQQENVSSAPTTDDPDLLLGHPRAIRSDEWSISTPTAVSQTVQGFPHTPWIGLTRTDATVSPYALPVLDYTTLLKPQLWGYLAFGPERGLAWAWWFPFLLSTCALYGLAWFITKRPLVAAGAAILGSLTPYVAWWSPPIANLILGYACLAALAASRGLLARSTWTGLAWAALCGWAVAASALVLYPPWTVSTGLLAAAFVLGLVIDARPALLRVVAVVAASGAVAAALVLPWALRVAPVLDVISGTIYPGQRRAGPGEGSVAALLSAPSNLVTAVKGMGPAILNQSEVASSWLPFAVLLLLTPLVLLAGRRPPRGVGAPVGKATLWALAAVELLMLAWMLVPGLPAVFGKLTLLNRVPGSRLPLALGLGLLLLALVLSTFDLSRVPRWLLHGFIATGALAATVGGILAAHELYPAMGWKGLTVTALGALLIGLAMAAVATGVALRVLLPLGVTYAVVSFGVISPLYRGLGPLTHDPVSLYAREVATEDADPVAVTLGGRELQALVRGGGMQVLSWTTQYPDWRFWEKVMPGGEEVWNNYRIYGWYSDPEAEPVRARIVAPDAAELYVDLCDPVIRELGYDRVFSPAPVDASCLVQDRVVDRGEQQVFVYRPVG